MPRQAGKAGGAHQHQTIGAFVNIESWIMLAVSIVIIPSVAWLVREVLALRGKMIEIQTRQDTMRENCDRHQRWNGEMQKTVSRMDKNIARLCQQAGVAETGE